MGALWITVIQTADAVTTIIHEKSAKQKLIFLL